MEENWIKQILEGVEELQIGVDEIVTHYQNDEKLYGNTDNDMAEDIPIKFTVAGGNNVQGTELMLTDGTIIESGSAAKNFHLNTLYIVSVSAANKISVLQFLYSDINTPVACTFTFTGGTVEDQVNAVAHGLKDNDKVVLKAGAGALPTELVDYRTYYVTGKSTDYFQVALTSGGAAVEFTDDGGACFWYPIKSSVQSAVQTNLTKKFISMSSTSNDAIPIPLIAPDIACNKRIFVRALSEAAATISIGFLLGLHTYTN